MLFVDGVPGPAELPSDGSCDVPPPNLPLTSSDTNIFHRSVLAFPAKSPGYSGTVRSIGLGEMLDLPLLNYLWHVLQTGGDVADQSHALNRTHEPEEISWLSVVILVKAMVVPIY